MRSSMICTISRSPVCDVTDFAGVDRAPSVRMQASYTRSGRRAASQVVGGRTRTFVVPNQMANVAERVADTPATLIDPAAAICDIYPAKIKKKIGEGR